MIDKDKVHHATCRCKQKVTAKATDLAPGEAVAYCPKCMSLVRFPTLADAWKAADDATKTTRSTKGAQRG